MGADEVKAFLSHLATEMNVAASTQNQAFSALLFLYQEVLKQRLPCHCSSVHIPRETDGRGLDQGLMRNRRFLTPSKALHVTHYSL